MILNKPNSQDPIRQKIRLKMFRVVSLVGAVLSLGCVLANIFVSSPQDLNVKWLGLLCMCIISYIASYGKFAEQVLFILFLFVTCVFLPMAFMDFGGFQNSTMGYIFLNLIAACYLFRGWKRAVLVAALPVMFVGMNLLQRARPDLIVPTVEGSDFLVRIVQIPIVLCICFVILYYFTKEYERAADQLYLLANYDDLTGLYNRRKFNEAMETTPSNPGRPIYLALIDLDNFKVINDTHGHHSGDVALMEFARILRQHFDLNRHMLFRWGGDEFAIIFSGPREELERALNTVELAYTTYLKQFDVPSGSISCSIVSFSDFASRKDLLIAADHLLYLNKQKSHLPTNNLNKTSVS